MAEQQKGRGSKGWWCVRKLCGDEVPWSTNNPWGGPKWKECGMDDRGDGKCQHWGWHRETLVSSIETTTCWVISLWSRICGQWRQGLWTCTGQMMDAWYKPPLSNRPWRQQNVDSRSPLGRETGRPGEVLAWPTPHGCRRTNSQAALMYGLSHHTEGGAWERGCPPVQMVLLDQS